MFNKKLLYSFYIILIIILTIFISNKINVKALNNFEKSETLDGIENFPESYKPYLEELKKNHPNWTFTALYTNLDWDYVIKNENVFGKNIVPK